MPQLINVSAGPFPITSERAWVHVLSFNTLIAFLYQSVPAARTDLGALQVFSFSLVLHLSRNCVESHIHAIKKRRIVTQEMDRLRKALQQSCLLHTPMSCAPLNYQETSITTDWRARFNLHLIATEAGCAAVNRDHGGCGVPKTQSVHPNSPVVSRAPLIFKNGTVPSSNQNTFLKQTNVRKDFASCAARCILHG